MPPMMKLREIIREQIRKGEITNRLPGGRSLQREFGLAPVTTRKAVRKLAEEGLVQTTPGMRAFVVEDSPVARSDRSSWSVEGGTHLAWLEAASADACVATYLPARDLACAPGDRHAD